MINIEGRKRISNSYFIEVPEKENQVEGTKQITKQIFKNYSFRKLPRIILKDHNSILRENT